MPDDNFQIRPMSRAELDIAVEWAADEGWNPGLHDADSFFAADSGGFLMGLLNGEPVADDFSGEIWRRLWVSRLLHRET